MKVMKGPRNKMNKRRTRCLSNKTEKTAEEFAYELLRTFFRKVGLFNKPKVRYHLKVFKARSDGTRAEKELRRRATERLLSQLRSDKPFVPKFGPNGSYDSHTRLRALF